MHTQVQAGVAGCLLCPASDFCGLDHSQESCAGASHTHTPSMGQPTTIPSPAVKKITATHARVKLTLVDENPHPTTNPGSKSFDERIDAMITRCDEDGGGGEAARQPATGCRRLPRAGGATKHAARHSTEGPRSQPSVAQDVHATRISQGVAEGPSLANGVSPSATRCCARAGTAGPQRSKWNPPALQLVALYMRKISGASTFEEKPARTSTSQAK